MKLAEVCSAGGRNARKEGQSKAMSKLKQAGTILIAICLALAIAGCGTAVTNNESMESEHHEEPADTEKEETMQIKVTDGANEVIFRLNNSSAAASLYRQLPLTLDVENYGSNEKIFYPPEKLDTADVIEGVCPAGTLAYFSSWGDVVMYYAPFGSYSGLYVMGEAVEGADCIKNLSGTITIKAT